MHVIAMVEDHAVHEIKPNINWQLQQFETSKTNFSWFFELNLMGPLGTCFCTSLDITTFAIIQI